MVPATAASGTIHSGLALHIGERGAEIDVKGLAGDHQRRDRGDAGRLGFRDPSRRVAEMDDLDVILRGIERMGEALFGADARSEEHTSELHSLMRISYAVFCLKTKNYSQTKLQLCN